MLTVSAAKTEPTSFVATCLIETFSSVSIGSSRRELSGRIVKRQCLKPSIDDQVLGLALHPERKSAYDAVFSRTRSGSRLLHPTPRCRDQHCRLWLRGRSRISRRASRSGDLALV